MEKTKKNNSLKRLYFYSEEFETAKKMYERACQSLQHSINNDTQLLGLEEPTSKVLNAFLDNKPDRLKNELYKSLESEIQTKNPVLQESIKEAVDKKYQSWKEKVNQRHRAVKGIFSDGKKVPLKWQYFKLENGRVTFNEKALEKDYSIYPDNDRRKEFLKLSQKAEKILDEMQGILRQTSEETGETIPKVVPDSNTPNDCFHYGNGKVSVNSEFLRFIK